jgi:hypothetical protein
VVNEAPQYSDRYSNGEGGRLLWMVGCDRGLKFSMRALHSKEFQLYSGHVQTHFIISTIEIRIAGMTRLRKQEIRHLCD